MAFRTGFSISAKKKKIIIIIGKFDKDCIESVDGFPTILIFLIHK